MDIAHEAGGISNSELADLIYGTVERNYTPQQIHQYLNFIREDEDASVSVDLMVKCLSTGTEQGRQAARESIRDAIDGINDAFGDAGINDFWHIACQRSWHPEIGINVLRDWTVGNLIQETGQDYRIYEVTDILPHIEGRIAQRGTIFNGLETTGIVSVDLPRLTDERYWRGAVALAMCFEVEHGRSCWEEFFQWSAMHQNTALIINTAMERNTLEVADLKDIIERGDAAPPVRNGVL